jgi:hypothetical protein
MTDEVYKSLTSPSPSPSQSATSPPTSTSQPVSQHSSGGGGLSRGAYAGIGIGVTIGALTLLAIAFLFFRRSVRRRNEAAAATGTQSGHYSSYVTELPGGYLMRPQDNQQIPELAASPLEKPPEELDSTMFREMPGTNY